MITQDSILRQDQALDPITKQVVVLLSEMGIVFPTRIDPVEIRQFPLDLTDAGLKELGELHSYWTAIYARDTGIHGMVVAQKRSVKFQLSKLKSAVAANNQIAKTKFVELEQTYARIDAMDAILTGVADGHKRMVDACSREITRRQIEVQLSR